MHTEALITCLAGRCMPRHYIGRARDTPFRDRFAVDGERMKCDPNQTDKIEIFKRIIVVRPSPTCCCSVTDAHSFPSAFPKFRRPRGQQQGKDKTVETNGQSWFRNVKFLMTLNCFMFYIVVLLVLRCVVA